MGSIVVERKAREERERDGLGGGPRPGLTSNAPSTCRSLDRNRDEIILSKTELYPMPILPVLSFNLRT